MQIFSAEDTLTAPGILKNPVPVRALVDTSAANEVTLRNLLQMHGYESLEDVEARKHTEGAVEALLTVLGARGLVPTDDQLAAIRTCHDPAVLQRWLARAAVATSIAAVFE